MTTYQTHDLFTEILRNECIPVAKLEYFRTRFRLAVYDLIASKFQRQETLNQKEYAARIHRKPEAINRLLSSPGNWTLDTVSDLLIGMAAVPVIDAEDVQAVLHAAASRSRNENLDALIRREGQKGIEVPQPKSDPQTKSSPQPKPQNAQL